ncbi:FAD/NAD(P)-binding protein [Saccharothrix australiensis]|uniref:Putative NAD(P)/FAD-binding protein YdhS n=1 Tax=Saccharothrix australiensis TaxID=2072 RepID=A0A495W0K9_9PSEU|nr:FAD/NAD(P)-binding protein [Saccharothrix australiensis]RKT55231.1 putative NAD(P)/FAD-binding protein YdhS [Saccharothrix australiensis]
MVRLPDRSRRVVIVGAGLGGTATAVRLLRFAREPLEVVLVERRPEYRCAGVAYHREGNHWHHVFNIQAGRMSMFREDVDDFVTWANTEADRAGWPPEWREVAFTESGPAPRRVYADYLADRLAEAAREAWDGVTLVEADGEVVDLAVDGDRVRVVVAGRPPRGDSEPDPAVLVADHVVVATGLEERELPFATEVADHPAFVRHPYSAEAIERLTALPPDATVAIVGTLLSAYDSAALLLRRGHTGPIHMISRSGLTLRTYPADHRHRVLDLPAPRLRRDTYEGRGELVRRFLEEWERACAVVAAEHPDVAPAVVTERISKSWEPHLPEVLARVPTADLRALLDGYGSLLATLRVSAVAYTTGIVDAAMGEGGQVALVTGRVERVRPTATGALAVSVSGAGAGATRTIEADLVISNFGREPDYARVGSRLWANLLRKGVAAAHARTGRGVEVDVDGVLLGPTGEPSGPISAVGGPREGDEIVRYGRMGAFAFNLAAIKNHSVGVAATVLRRLEACYDERGRDLAVATTAEGGEAREAFDRCVTLDVRRMATRRRRDRAALAARLDEGLAVLRAAAARAGGAAPPDGALRSAVNAAATTKLNDLSVTPRELRALLGLDERVGPVG